MSKKSEHSSHSQKRIAILPARGGSKRIPRKNIREFFGIPAIAYGIQAAKTADIFDDIIVSTDDDEIAATAEELGASVPFRRSAENADDNSTTSDVLREVLQTLEKDGRVYNECCCIYPTAVFVTAKRLLQAHRLLNEGAFDQTFPVLAFPCAIERALRLNERNRLYSVLPEHVHTRTQDLQKSYYDAGQFYWFKTAGFCQRDSLMTDNAGVIIYSEMSVHDIDTEADWLIAEKKFLSMMISPNGTVEKEIGNVG